jgi:hypothetical protein
LKGANRSAKKILKLVQEAKEIEELDALLA